MMLALMLASVVLVQDGRPTCSLSLPADASPSMQRGADELKHFLFEMSGALMTSKPPERCTVALRETAEFGPEGFSIKTSPNGVTIAGGRQRGVMYGVYALLERLGCRWFSRDITRIPKMRTVRVPALDVVERPAFEMRWPGITEAVDKDWAARNRLNGGGLPLDDSTGGRVECSPCGHSFHWLIPSERFFTEHPDWFALVDGRRRATNAQLCLTNPEVIRAGIDRIFQWIGEHPEVDIVGVCQEDSKGYCECERCRRVEAEEGGAHSGPIVRFVNALAEAVSKKYPDKRILTYAYQYSEPAPRTRPHPNVRIQLAPISACVSHPAEQCPRNKELLLDNLKAWTALSPQVYMYGYATNFSHFLYPFPDFDRLAADIPLFQRIGVKGVYYEGSHLGAGGYAAEMRAWVMAKLMWNPRENVSSLVDEYLAGAYGPAARPMRAIHDLLHEQVRLGPGGKGKHLWIDQAPWLDRDVVERCRALYRQARAAAPNDVIRRRIDHASLWIEYADLFESRRYQIRNGEYVPTDPDGLLARFQAFLKKKNSFGVGVLNNSERDDSVTFGRSLATYPVLTIENARFRADVVPGLSARIVRLLDKRTGRDLARKANPAGVNYPDGTGIMLAIHPDPGGDGFAAKWETVSHSGSELTLRGTLPNGLVLTRRLALTANQLISANRVTNQGEAGRDVMLLARFDTNPANIDDVRFENAPGVVTLRNGRQGLTLRGAFEPAAVNRAFGGVDERHGNRASIVLWTPSRHLEPGAATTLDVTYTVE